MFPRLHDQTHTGRGPGFFGGFYHSLRCAEALLSPAILPCLPWATTPISRPAARPERMGAEQPEPWSSVAEKPSCVGENGTSSPVRLSRGAFGAMNGSSGGGFGWQTGVRIRLPPTGLNLGAWAGIAGDLAGIVGAWAIPTNVMLALGSLCDG